MHDFVNRVSPPLFPATGVARGAEGEADEVVGWSFCYGRGFGVVRLSPGV